MLHIPGDGTHRHSPEAVRRRDRFARGGLLTLLRTASPLPPGSRPPLNSSYIPGRAAPSISPGRAARPPLPGHLPRAGIGVKRPVLFPTRFAPNSSGRVARPPLPGHSTHAGIGVKRPILFLTRCAPQYPGRRRADAVIPRPPPDILTDHTTVSGRRQFSALPLHLYTFRPRLLSFVCPVSNPHRRRDFCASLLAASNRVSPHPTAMRPLSSVRPVRAPPDKRPNPRAFCFFEPKTYLCRNAHRQWYLPRTAARSGCADDTCGR